MQYSVATGSGSDRGHAVEEVKDVDDNASTSTSCSCDLTLFCASGDGKEESGEENTERRGSTRPVLLETHGAHLLIHIWTEKENTRSSQHSWPELTSGRDADATFRENTGPGYKSDDNVGASFRRSWPARFLPSLPVFLLEVRVFGCEGWPVRFPSKAFWRTRRSPFHPPTIHHVQCSC